MDSILHDALKRSKEQKIVLVGEVFPLVRMTDLFCSVNPFSTPQQHTENQVYITLWTSPSFFFDVK